MSKRLFVNWLVTERCNFRCRYCSIFNPFTTRKKILRKVREVVPRRSWPSPKYDLREHLDTVLNNFRETGRDVCFGFTGGEPFVYPGFLEIIRRIALEDRFTVALDTNLSVGDIGDLIGAVPPGKMEYIFTSLHVEERERLYGSLDGFLEDVSVLDRNGYSIGVNYVLAPYLLDRFREDYEYCLSRGVKLVPKMFKGVFEGNKYPASYSPGEISDIFLRYSPEYSRDKLKHRRTFGMRCSAGLNIVRVRGNGDMVPCLEENTLLGNVYAGFRLNDDSIVCRARQCACWSLDNLIDDRGDRAVQADPVPPGILEKSIGKFHKLRGWWQGD
jgi:MoaA/NifB/PqqE/SkfB family radical SAM enzyme